MFFLSGCLLRPRVLPSGDAAGSARTLRSILPLKAQAQPPAPVLLLCFLPRFEAQTDSSFLRLEKNVYTSDDFTGSICDLIYYIDLAELHTGKNYGRITLENIYQHLTYEITIIRTPERREQEHIDYLEEQRTLAHITGIYLNYRMKKIGAGLFASGIDREKRNLGVMCDGFYSLKDGIVYYQSENEEKYSVDDMITDSRGETETLQNIREELEYISEDGLKPIKVSKDGETYDVDDKAYSDWTHYYGNTLLYASLSDFKPIDLAEIQEDEDFIENVEEKIELEFLDAGLHLVSGDNEVVVTGDAARDLLTMIDNDENGMSIYINETDVIASSDEQVVAAKIDKGKVSQFELVSDMGYPITANKSAIYYATNQQKDGDIIYYDVYAYHNGKSKCIVPHASMNLVDIYEDGEILANTDCNDGLNLSLINSKGKEYLIGEDVSSYIKYEKRRNKTI